MQEILPLDYGLRMQYCHWFNNHLRNDETLNLTFFSDEAWFYLSGYINSQNYRIWSTETPNEIVQAPLHSVKIGVYIAMSRRRIVGPVFFENTVTANRYREFLEIIINQLDDEEITRGYYQHDNATAHTAAQTQHYLEEFYEDRVISRGLWPPRSPDLTPLDYFLFGHLKNTVYKNRLHTVDDLKNAITDAVQNISPQQLENVFENMKRRIDMCINNNGGHIEHIM